MLNVFISCFSYPFAKKTYLNHCPRILSFSGLKILYGRQHSNQHNKCTGCLFGAVESSNYLAILRVDSTAFTSKATNAGTLKRPRNHMRPRNDMHGGSNRNNPPVTSATLLRFSIFEFEVPKMVLKMEGFAVSAAVRNLLRETVVMEKVLF